MARCPACDIRDAFRHARGGYDRYLTRRMVQFFLRRNRRTLGHINGYDHCAAAMTMTDFHDQLHPLTGSKPAKRSISAPIR